MTAAPAPAPVTPTPLTTTAPSSYVPRWGVQTGLLQRRQPAFWMFVVLLVLGGLTILSEQLLFLQYFPSGWIFSIVLLAIYVAPLLIFIYILDLFEREPLSLLLAAFLWGGLVATAVAITANTALLQAFAKLFGPVFAQTWGPALVAPPVEETLKYLGVVTIFLIARSEMNDLFDGFVYGAIVGLGFAAVEHVQYFVQSIGQPGAGDQIGPVLQMFFFRAILFGGYMHILWTGLTGIGFAYYVTQLDQPRSKRLQVAVGLFVLAVVAHITWNSPLLNDLLSGIGGAVVYGLIKGLPFLIALIILVRLAQNQSNKWFRTIAAADIGTDLISEQEAADLASLRTRRAARLRMGTRKGPQAGRLQGQLQKEQINLAMIRSYTNGEETPAIVEQRERIRGIRAQIDAMPDVPQPVVQPYVAPVAPSATIAPGAFSTTAPSSPAATPTAAAAAPAMTSGVAPDTNAAAAAPSPAMPAATSATPVATPAMSAAASATPAAAQAAPAAAPAMPSAASATPEAAQAAPAAAQTPPAAPPAPVWAHTHVVPVQGMAAWAAPDPAQPPVAHLSGGVLLVVLEETGAWARVQGSNGWTGWVDGMLLVRVA
jgi:RsiW-degrading membrane proteinase PrsW (M82 family)